MTKYSDTITINAEVFWSYDMTHPPTEFNPDNKRFQITLGQLSKADQEKLKGIGCKIKTKQNDAYNVGPHIVAKSQFEIVAFDKNGDPVDSSKIGNGTKVTVSLNAYEHRMSAAHGFAPSTKRITVNELVVYNKDAQEEMDDVL
jgi:hypothetical protein